MSISGALSSALSGLTASSRAADVSASNIANSMTDGYGVREIVLTPRAIGDDGGVRVSGVRRNVDQVLLSDRRNAEASLSKYSVLDDFYSRLQTSMGLPNQEGSFTSRMSNLEASLVEATLAPESDALLTSVVNDLDSLATQLNDLSASTQEERVRADSQIGTEVGILNRTLSQIETLNEDIRKHTVLGHDVSALLDQRQTMIDSVNEIIPVTELDRDYGGVALMASGGTFLLDGQAATVEFTESSIITPHLSLSAGTLSGLAVNGTEINLERSPSTISGGKLEALFQIRDHDAVQYQERLDGLARDLIERLETSTVDTTRAAVDPGLLTDDGALFDAVNEVGLAQRISVNALVDPNQGGESWRIRDGLGVSSPIPGGEGNSGLIVRISEILNNYQSAASATFSSSSFSASSLAAEVTSFIGGEREAARSSASYSQVQYDVLKELELAKGVDTDAEMQKLLLIEQSYAANARVIQVADEMLDWLMRI